MAQDKPKTGPRQVEIALKGLSWGCLGALLGSLGALLGSGSLGALLAFLGLSWAVLGLSWAVLGCLETVLVLAALLQSLKSPKHKKTCVFRFLLAKDTAA